MIDFNTEKNAKLFEEILTREGIPLLSAFDVDERLCDYVALGHLAPPHLAYFINEYSCICELKRRVFEYPLEKILEMAKYIGSMIPVSACYAFPARLLLYRILDRSDKEDLMKRFAEEKGFELIGHADCEEQFIRLSQEKAENNI